MKLQAFVWGRPALPKGEPIGSHSETGLHPSPTEANTAQRLPRQSLELSLLTGVSSNTKSIRTIIFAILAIRLRQPWFTVKGKAYLRHLANEVAAGYGSAAGFLIGTMADFAIQ